MATINRFSKDVRPSEFNPMSADDIMRVPLLKGQMEQEQLAAIEEKRLAMLNVDVAPADMERVRAEQARLSKGFDDLVGKITTEGVSSRSTDAVNKYLKEYNTVTSKAGLIGTAGQFAADRKAKMAEDRNLAIKRGFDMQKWDKLYSAYDSRQTSTDSEGNLVGEYKNLNTPNYIDPVLEFQDLIKGKLGSIKEGSTLGDYTESNRSAIMSATDEVMRKYKEEPDYRQMMDDLYGDGTPGSANGTIMQKLANAANTALEESYVSWKQEPLTPAQQAAQNKAKADAAAAADETNKLKRENILDVTEGGIEAVQLYGPKELEKLKVAAESDKTGEASREYLKALAHNENIVTEFQKKEGANITKELRETTDALEQVAEPSARGSYEQVMEYVDRNATKQSITAGPGSGHIGNEKIYTEDGPLQYNSRSNHVVVQNSQGEWLAFEKNDPRIEAITKVKEVYNNAFEQFAGEGNLHSNRVWYSPMSAAVGGTSAEKTNTDIIKKIDSDLRDVAVGKSPDVRVAKVSRTYTAEGDGEITEVEAPDKTPEELEKYYRDILQSYVKSGDLRDLKFALPTDTKPGAVQITFDREEIVDKLKRTVTYTMNLDMLGDENSAWGILMSQGLAAGDIDQTTTLAKAYKDNQELKNIQVIPRKAPASMKYATSNDLDYVAAGGEVYSGLRTATDEPMALYSLPGGKVAMRTKKMGGISDYTLTRADILKGIDLTSPDLHQTNPEIQKWLAEEYAKEHNIPLSKVYNDEAFLQFSLDMQTGNRSVKRFEADDKNEYLNIVRAPKRYPDGE